MQVEAARASRKENVAATFTFRVLYQSLGAMVPVVWKTLNSPYGSEESILRTLNGVSRVQEGGRGRTANGEGRVVGHFRKGGRNGERKGGERERERRRKRDWKRSR